MDVGERRGSRSSKQRFSAGNRDLILPLDDTLPPSVDFPPRTPPKLQRIEAVHRATKSHEKSPRRKDESEESPQQQVTSPKPSPQPQKRSHDTPSPTPKPKPLPKPVIQPGKTTPPVEEPLDIDPWGFTENEKALVAPAPQKSPQIAALPLPAVAPPPLPSSSAMNVTMSPPALIAPIEQKQSLPRTAIAFSTEPFFAEKEPISPRPRVLFALTGSVATIKLNDILSSLTKTADVIVVATKSAEHFVANFGDSRFDGVRYYNDASEYAMWHARNDPVLHIELRKWADIFLIAPLSANSLAKLANGLCDNLVTSIARAWDFERPFYIAPAMNTLMWTHPFTQKHLTTLEELGIKTIQPIQKTLMCGDKGVGAMADVPTIVQEIQSALSFYPRRH